MYLRRYFSEWYLHSNVWTFKECFKNKNNVVTQQSASYLPSTLTLSLYTPYSTEANPIGTVFTFRIFPIIYAELLCRALLEHPKSEWIFTWGVVNSWLLLRKEKKPSKQIGKNSLMFREAHFRQQTWFVPFVLQCCRVLNGEENP